MILWQISDKRDPEMCIGIPMYMNYTTFYIRVFSFLIENNWTLVIKYEV